MITKNQLLANKRKGKKKQNVLKAKNKTNPRSCQMSGVVKKLVTSTPKKPNSAVRKTAKVKASDGKEYKIYVPGESNGVAEFASILFRYGRVKDLPGVNAKMIPGARDAPAIANRKQGRSKYGAKKAKK